MLAVDIFRYLGSRAKEVHSVTSIRPFVQSSTSYSTKAFGAKLSSGHSPLDLDTSVSMPRPPASCPATPLKSPRSPRGPAPVCPVRPPGYDQVRVEKILLDFAFLFLLRDDHVLDVYSSI